MRLFMPEGNVMPEIVLEQGEIKRLLSALELATEQLTSVVRCMRDEVDDVLIAETEEEAEAYQSLVECIKEQLR